jgi:hypothetical protein
MKQPAEFLGVQRKVPTEHSVAIFRVSFVRVTIGVRARTPRFFELIAKLADDFARLLPSQQENLLAIFNCRNHEAQHIRAHLVAGSEYTQDPQP